ncbi:hypothetical protein RND71_032588 [Anisodus tanguticus]|uniref:Uncharacterized protein n=1 Tax=Anisodus tanguticus TaxID=243964 RepID=A0AAE1R7Q8_9SOLA|nr:hypothetical protein RND71_032588 [Anisodus tanguticus]
MPNVRCAQPRRFMHGIELVTLRSRALLHQLGYLFSFSFCDSEIAPRRSCNRMGTPTRSSNTRRGNEMMRLLVTTIAGVVLGLSTQDLLYVLSSFRSPRGCSHRHSDTKIWVPSNPRGAERLPPDIVASESDLYPRRLWGLPREDLIIKPRYLVCFTVGYEQKNNIHAAVKKENFTFMLFHYDGRTSEWDDLEWSTRAIHVSARKQTKWWYAKRFLHPDIVAPYDYIFIWDEDLGLENFDAEEYIKLVRQHGVDISQPGVASNRKQRKDLAGALIRTCHHVQCIFVEIMAPVFSREAWRCVWYMIQNDLVHGWGLDLALRKCVEVSNPPYAVRQAHEKIGVVDSQWIMHHTVPSLGNQGQAEKGKAPWEGVRERCKKEWTMFKERMAAAEKDYYYKAKGIDPLNSTSH